MIIIGHVGMAFRVVASNWSPPGHVSNDCMVIGQGVCAVGTPPNKCYCASHINTRGVPVLKGVGR